MLDPDNDDKVVRIKNWTQRWNLTYSFGVQTDKKKKKNPLWQ